MVFDLMILKSVKYVVFFSGLFLIFSSIVFAENLPADLEGVSIEANIGAVIPDKLEFLDHKGEKWSFSSLRSKNKPIILTLGYWRCPMLCSLVLNGLVASLDKINYQLGRDFFIVSLSIDPRETTELAFEKRKNYLAGLKNKFSEDWFFLTGNEQNINQLAKNIGFSFRYNETTKQYAHAAGVFFITPQLKLGRVLYGIEYSARDMNFAILETADGKLGNALDKFLLYCFHYDPKEKKYTFFILNLIRIFGVLTVMFLSIWLYRLRKFDKQERIS